MQIKYPYSKQNIFEKDITAVIKAMRSTYITQGTEVEKLEKEISKTMGSKFAIIVNSGTAALHISYHLLGVNKNMGIITSRRQSVRHGGYFRGSKEERTAYIRRCEPCTSL